MKKIKLLSLNAASLLAVFLIYPAPALGGGTTTLSSDRTLVLSNESFPEDRQIYHPNYLEPSQKNDSTGSPKTVSSSRVSSKSQARQVCRLNGKRTGSSCGCSGSCSKKKPGIKISASEYHRRKMYSRRKR